MTKNSYSKHLQLNNCTIIQAGVRYMFEYRCPEEKCNLIVQSMVEHEDRPALSSMTVEEVGHHEATTAESSGSSAFYADQHFFCRKHLELTREPRISYKLKMTIAHENQVYALFGYSEKIEKLMNMAAKDLHDWLLTTSKGSMWQWRYLCRLLERTLIKVRCRFAIESSKSSGYYRAQSEWRIVDLAPIDTPSIPIIDRVFDSITRNGEQTNSNDDDEHHYLLAWHSPPTNFKFVASGTIQ